MEFRLGWLALVGLALGCGAGGAGRVDVPASSDPTPESAEAPAPEPEPQPAPEPEPAEAEAAAPEPAASVAPAPACVVLGLGLDLRALGTHNSPNAVDMFVLGQADDLRRAAAGTPPRIEHIPGAGLLYAFFDGERESDELARCDQARARYLADAPRLPILMQPVASVSVPCQPCDQPR